MSADRSDRPDRRSVGSGPRRGQSNAPAEPEPTVWHVPVAVHEIPIGGRHFDLKAGSEICKAVSALGELVAVNELKAHFDLTRVGEDGLRVTGRVSGLVVQSCVVTLDPVENRIDEAIELVFMPEGPSSAGSETVHTLDDAEPPEPLLNGVVDLGEIAVEFLLLGVDPYPRAVGAALPAPSPENTGNRPFAALASLAGRKPSDA